MVKEQNERANLLHTVFSTVLIFYRLFGLLSLVIITSSFSIDQQQVDIINTTTKDRQRYIEHHQDVDLPSTNNSGANLRTVPFR
jgi:hypothetical protein